MTLMPSEKIPNNNPMLIIIGILSAIFILFIIIPNVHGINLFPWYNYPQPPAGYDQTYLYGGSWAEEMIKEDASFQQHGVSSTLKMTDVGMPWDTSMPFSYYFTFNDTNSSTHHAVVYIGQDAGSWKNGPFYDGWENRTF